MLTENFNISIKDMATFKFKLPRFLHRARAKRHSLTSGILSIPPFNFVRTKVLADSNGR